MDTLEHLARAFDTKGYPDDKDPRHWRTIQHTHVHLDANGNIDGGAWAKGKKWSSTKHPHNPAHYPQPAKPAAPPAPPKPPAPPPVTRNDLLNSWKTVTKYMVAIKQAKSQKYKQQNAQKLLQAIDAYNKLKATATPAVQAQHKPRVSAATTFANNTLNPPATPAPQPTAAPQSPLSGLANATTPPAATSQQAPATPQSPLSGLANATTPQQNNLQPPAASGNVKPNQGRNVKLYNLSKSPYHSKSRFVYSLASSLGLDTTDGQGSGPMHQKDINAMAKEVALELKNRNKNYGTMTVADAAKQKTSQLIRNLMSVADSKLNPTVQNGYACQRLGMALGWNAPPKVLPKAAFDKAAQNSPYPVVYRGMESTSTYDERTLVDDLKYGDTTWRGGSCCIWGVGIYTSTQRSCAEYYADKIITKAFIDPSAKVIEWDDLVTLAKKNGIANVEYDGPRGSQAKDAISVFAMQLGYQVVKVNGGNSHSKGHASTPNRGDGDFYNVLDRSCLVVQKEDG